MPIRPEFRQFYGRVWREEIRPRILKRARNKCEQCGVPNNTEVLRVRGCWLDQKVSWKFRVLERWRGADGKRLKEEPEGPQRRVRIVLGVAHINHTPGQDDDDNLRAWCQWCHLHHDAVHHRETRATRKDATRPLLAQLSEAS
jgi:hypothetical protein